MRVGLLGGSFNPPHQGHVHISRIALDCLNLDAVWWLVTPQNPLKDTKDTLPLDKRVALCREIMQHPKILVTDIEKDLNSRYTYETVLRLNRHFPDTQFAWITGIDNALTLHQWNEWHRLLREVCMVHITRSPAVSLIRNCPLRMLGTQKHVILKRGGAIPLDSGTTYWLLQKRMVDISSTEIRKHMDEKSIP